MPNLIKKKLKENHGDDKIFHYGNHKLYSYDSRPGYRQRKDEVI